MIKASDRLLRRMQIEANKNIDASNKKKALIEASENLSKEEIGKALETESAEIKRLKEELALIEKEKTIRKI